jgi:hypothetical protein
MDYIFSLLMSYGILIIIILGIAQRVWRLESKKMIIVVALLLGVYGCWQVVYPSGTWRYKLTLVVDDNGKQIVSSSVRQVHVQVSPKILPAMNNSVSVKGEAVVVDLGKKGVLFALLRGNQNGGVDYGYNIVFYEFPNLGGTTPEGIRAYKHLKAKKELSFAKIPMLVHFRDINDPKTVELVDPNDLEKTFGAGVKLVSATIEMTDERVTWRMIEKRLTWLKKLKGGYLDGQFASMSNELSNVLHGGDFRTGVDYE